MFSMVRKFANTLSDYTVGTAIVLVHLALAGPREDAYRAPRLLGSRPSQAHPHN